MDVLTLLNIIKFLTRKGSGDHQAKMRKDEKPRVVLKSLQFKRLQ
jgi:hypothetical protein